MPLRSVSVVVETLTALVKAVWNVQSVGELEESMTCVPKIWLTCAAVTTVHGVLLGSPIGPPPIGGIVKPGMLIGGIVKPGSPGSPPPAPGLGRVIGGMVGMLIGGMLGML